MFGVFCVKNHDFTPKIKFFPILGWGGCAPLESAPDVDHPSNLLLYIYTYKSALRHLHLCLSLVYMNYVSFSVANIVKWSHRNLNRHIFFYLEKVCRNFTLFAILPIVHLQCCTRGVGTVHHVQKWETKLCFCSPSCLRHKFKKKLNLYHGSRERKVHWTLINPSAKEVVTNSVRTCPYSVTSTWWLLT